MLSDKEIVCPNNLLNAAHKKKGVVAGIVNAGKPLPMLSVMDAVNEDLIIPIFIGDKDEIQKCADNLKFDISKFETIHEPVENNTAKIAAKLASENKIRIIVKGHIHTDVLMKEVLKREYNLLSKTRLSHIWHMTLDKEDKPLIITDGALNVLPNVKTKMHILKKVINISNRIGNILSLKITLCIWGSVCLIAFALDRTLPNIDSYFYLMGIVLGFVLGATQTLTRSTYSKLLPETQDHATYFSFYDVTEKIAIVLGMFLFGFLISLTGSMQYSVLALAIFFFLAFIIFFKVKNFHSL